MFKLEQITYGDDAGDDADDDTSTPSSRIPCLTLVSGALCSEHRISDLQISV